MIRPNVNKSGGKRQGRGFSLKEIEQAGLTWHQAGLLGVNMDRRRKTSHEDNVAVLRYLKQEAQSAVQK